MDFVKEIIDSGGQVAVVGGATRTDLCNKLRETNLKIKDKDIIIRNIKENILVNILAKYGKVSEVGKSFGVIKFKPFEFKELGELDIALPRIDKSTGTKHTDFLIVTDPSLSFKEDFSRRDATINAIGILINSIDELINFTTEGKILIDPFNGTSDIMNKQWKAVGDPALRFSEDPVRILRAVRQCAEMDFELESNTKNSIIKNKNLLVNIKSIAPTRMIDEFMRIIKSKNPNPMLEFMEKSEIDKIFELPVYTENEKNILMTIFTYGINLRIKLSIILMVHRNDNINKWTKKFELSASQYFDKNDVPFLVCINKLINNIDFITHDLDMRLFMQKLENTSLNNVHNFMSDIITYYGIINKKDVSYLNDLYNRNINAIYNTNQIKLDGNDIMTTFNIFGKDIKKIKEWLLSEITKDNVTNTTESLMEYVKANKDKILL
jgi:tRNA nucleotidyltransferase/poly(A) polymerase